MPSLTLKTRECVDLAGPSVPLVFWKVPPPSKDQDSRALPNNNWLTAVDPRDTNVRDAVEPGQSGLPTTLRITVSLLKTNTHTRLLKETVKLNLETTKSLTTNC